MFLIADTSLLINFLKVEQMHLVGKHDPRCAITEHVLQEISEPQQKKTLRKAVADGHLDSDPENALRSLWLSVVDILLAWMMG
jgi:hypothetical protein